MLEDGQCDRNVQHELTRVIDLLLTAICMSVFISSKIYTAVIFVYFYMGLKLGLSHNVANLF
jgi:hypothetical protein